MAKPAAPGNSISSLHYLNKDIVWASVKSGGTILKSTDGGETWKIISLPESFYVDDVFFINNDVGWVCGEHYLFGTTDGGKNWNVQLYDSSHSFYTITFSDEKLGWVAGLSRIYNTTDGGETWLPQVDFKGHINSLFLLDSLHIWAVNTDGPVGSVGGGIFYTKDGGKNWIADSTIDWGYDIQFVDSLNGWVSGRYTIAHTTDAGKTWNIQLNTPQDTWMKISMADEMHGWAITYNAKLAVTNNGGKDWIVKDDLNTYMPNTILFYDSLNGLVAGSGGVIVKTTDGGRNWESIIKSATAYNADLWDIIFIDDSTGWICGGEGIRSNDGIILKTTNGGSNWVKKFKAINKGPLRSISFFDEQNGFAVGGDSTILKTTDGGISWSSINKGIENWYDVDFSNYPIGWIIGNSNTYIHGRLIKTTDGGKTWNDVTSLTFSAGFPEIQFTSKNVGWIKTDAPDSTGYTRLYKTTDSGINWLPVLSSERDDLYSMDFISNEIGWISTEFYPGLIFHTTNGGGSWETYNTPGALLSISFVDSLTGWGTALGNRDMYKTTDGGKTWIPQHAYSTYLNKIKFINNNHGFAIGFYGAILSTTTSGITSIKEESRITVPDNFILYQNYPNPFNPSTTIQYSIPVSLNPTKGGTLVQLKIYDILGREIKTLVNEKQHPGTYTINFTASGLSSGVYFYQIRTGSYVSAKKMVYLK